MSIKESLKDEIAQIICDDYKFPCEGWRWNLLDDSNREEYRLEADKILSLVKKRIDEEIKRYNDKMISYHGQVDHSVDYYNCDQRIEGLAEFKETLE